METRVCLKNLVHNCSSLLTATVVNTKTRQVENKILDHDKHITTQECNKLTAEDFFARLKQDNLVSKTEFK